MELLLGQGELARACLFPRPHWHPFSGPMPIYIHLHTLGFPLHGFGTVRICMHVSATLNSAFGILGKPTYILPCRLGQTAYSHHSSILAQQTRNTQRERERERETRFEQEQRIHLFSSGRAMPPCYAKQAAV